MPIELWSCIAKFNPLVKEAPQNVRLTLNRLGFTEDDLHSSYFTGNYLNGVELTPKRQSKT